MRDPEWVMLTDAQRGQLVAIWLLAADNNGIIPSSASLVKKLCHMDTDPDLNLFISLKFLIGDAIVTPSGSQSDANVTHQTRLDKTRPDKKVTGRFTPPTLKEVSDYCDQRKALGKPQVDPETFIDHYEAGGWMRNKTKIKCWKSCVRTWEKSQRRHETPKNQIGQKTYERLQQALQGSGGQGNSDDQQYVPQLTIGKKDGEC